MKLPNSFKLIISLILPHFAGFIGSKFAIVGVTVWYDVLTKPDLILPLWVFGPIWSLLYTLMGIALYLVWKKDGEKKGVGLSMWLFGIQLGLNILWPFFFFFKQRPETSFIIMCVLFFIAFLAMISFVRVSKKGALLLLPYILWLLFVGYLNYSVCKLQKEIDKNLIVQTEKSILS